MNKKQRIITIIIVLIIGILISLTFGCIYNNRKYNAEIPDDYIAAFNGGAGEITYTTYIYKIDNGHANYGFKYINTVNTTVSWGSPEWNIKVVDKGEVGWTDEVFTVAKNNGAYSYVRLPNDRNTYSIEEFMSMFLMN